MSNIPRNLLISGNPDTGKTSLSIALARGIFPPPESVPKRFEGWNLNINPVDFGGGVGAKIGAKRAIGGTPTLKRTSSSNSASGSSSSGVATSSTGKGCVSFTLWEDWSRRKVDESESESESESDSEEQKENEEARRKREEEEEIKKRLAEKADSIQTRHVLTSQNSNSGGVKVKEEEDEQALGRLAVPCKPPRPCLSPRPDVILLCFSSIDLDSFVECETVIWPELTERYPLVPVILVANKCDLKDRPELGQDHNRGRYKDDEDSPPSSLAESISNPDSPRLGNPDSPRLGLPDISEGQPHTRQRFGFVVSSDMGVAMAKRIGASAYIECSCLQLKGLRPILQEILNALHDSPALRATASLPSSPILSMGSTGSGKKKDKKNSAPSFLFPGSKKNKSKSSTIAAFNRSKAASLNFIRGHAASLNTS